MRDLYRNIIDFKKGYHPRTHIVKDEKGDLVADSHSILDRWRNHFSQLLNVHRVNDVRQTNTHSRTTSAWTDCLWVWDDYWKPKKSQSPGMDQIPTYLLKLVGRSICSEMHKLINSIWNQEELPEEWKESIIVLVYKIGNTTDCSNYRGMSICQLCTKFYPTSCFQG